MGGKASTASKNKYNEKAYDRIALVVPKGRKEIIQTHAQERGESLNRFIGRAIDETMTRDDSRIIEITEEPIGAAGMISLPSDVLETVQKAVEATEENIHVFVARSVKEQAKRDKISFCMGINPATVDKLQQDNKKGCKQ